MSPLAFVFMLIAAIIILTVLTLKFKMHPVMVLFITATFCGIASGQKPGGHLQFHHQLFWFHAGQHRRQIIFGAVIAAGHSAIPAPSTQHG